MAQRGYPALVPAGQGRMELHHFRNTTAVSDNRHNWKLCCRYAGEALAEWQLGYNMNRTARSAMSSTRNFRGSSTPLTCIQTEGTRELIWPPLRPVASQFP